MEGNPMRIKVETQRGEQEMLPHYHYGLLTFEFDNMSTIVEGRRKLKLRAGIKVES